MKNKKSSIEVLEDFLSKHCNPIVCDIEWSDFKIAIQEAKAMHKEEIIDAHFDGRCDETEYYSLETATEYYNETFNNND